jgi:putative endonuclease
MPFMYILKCIDETYYTGSTVDMTMRLAQHKAGEGANYTKNRLPVELVFLQRFDRIDEAFNREKQVQKWTRKKKEALIAGRENELPLLAKKQW